MNVKKRKFVFEIEIEEYPNIPELNQNDATDLPWYAPNFKRNCWAFAHLSDVFKDAISHCANLKCLFACDKDSDESTKQKQFAELDRRIRQYESLLQKIKCVDDYPTNEKRQR